MVAKILATKFGFVPDCSLTPRRRESNLKNVITNSRYGLSSWARLTKLLSCEFHRTPLMISQHWFTVQQMARCHQIWGSYDIYSERWFLYWKGPLEVYLSCANWFVYLQLQAQAGGMAAEETGIQDDWLTVHWQTTSEQTAKQDSYWQVPNRACYLVLVAISGTTVKSLI